MKKSKVLYVSPCSERSGAEQLTKLFILNHSEAWQPSIVFLKEGAFVDELRKLGITCFVLPENLHVRLRNPKSFYSGVRFLSELIRSENIDLVHSVMGYGHLLGGMAAQKAKRPEVWYQHGPTGNLDYLTGRVPTRCIFTNSKFTEKCQEKYHARTPKVELIYPAIAPSTLSISIPDARQKFGIAPDAQVFGLVGRISSMKGQREFVDVALKLLQNRPQLQFMLIGSSFENHQTEYAREVFKKIKTSPFSDRFICTGYLPNPEPAMQACDVIVNASTTAEPFGLTLIEAMQLGKTVIAPAQGGPLEIIDEGKDGFFYEPRNLDSLAAQIVSASKLTQNLEKRHALSQAAREKVRSKFGLNRMMKQLEAEYRLILGDA